MWRKAFWAETAERAIKTFAQVSAALLAGNQLGILAVDFGEVASIAALAALVSVLTSIGSAPFGGTTGSASLVTPAGMDSLAAVTRGLITASASTPVPDNRAGQAKAAVLHTQAKAAEEVLEDLGLRRP